MNNNKGKIVQNVTIIVLAVALIVMSVGYAAYSQTLTINGTATVQKANWDIHFENIQANNTAIDTAKDTGYTITPVQGTATIDDSKHNVTFTTTLDVNQEYSFYVDVVNDGTFNADINSIDLQVSKGEDSVSEGVDAANAKYTNDYLTYEVTTTDAFEKGGTAPTTFNKFNPSAATPLALNSKQARKLLVKVLYEQPAQNDDGTTNLPTTQETYTFKLSFDAVQVNK